jgi:MFS family permease
VINNAVVPSVYNASKSLGTAFLVGFIICLLSVMTGVGLILMDKYADKVDGETSKMISEEDKFKISDIKTFSLSFWIICGSCVFTYMCIFPFLMVSTSLFELKFHFSDITAPNLTSIPYLISACTSPFLGLLIDKIGKRVHLGKYLQFIYIMLFY